MPKSSVSEFGQILRIRSLQNSFAEVVRKLRLRKGISQEEFADRAGLHRTYISDIERGVRNISLSNIVRIAEALEIPVSKIMQMSEKMSAEKKP